MSSDDDQTTMPAVRPLTAQLYTALMLDGWPSHATCQDFGLTSQEHYRALQQVVREGEMDATLTRLDQVLGDGPQITAFVREVVPDAPEFTTPYDPPPGMAEMEPDADGLPDEGPEAEAGAGGAAQRAAIADDDDETIEF